MKDIKNKRIIYAVIGSRGVNDYKLVKNTLDRFKIIKIISGGARGADALAARYAKEHSIPLIEIRPDYGKYGDKAPLVRNKEIVEQSQAVIAFWDGVSRGTLYTMNYAKKKNRPLEIVDVLIILKRRI